MADRKSSLSESESGLSSGLRKPFKQNWELGLPPFGMALGAALSPKFDEFGLRQSHCMNNPDELRKDGARPPSRPANRPACPPNPPDPPDDPPDPRPSAAEKWEWYNIHRGWQQSILQGLGASQQDVCRGGLPQGFSTTIVSCSMLLYLSDPYL